MLRKVCEPGWPGKDGYDVELRRSCWGQESGQGEGGTVTTEHNFFISSKEQQQKPTNTLIAYANENILEQEERSKHKDARPGSLAT